MHASVSLPPLFATLLLLTALSGAPASARLPFQDGDGDDAGLILRLEGQGDRDGQPVDLTITGSGWGDVRRSDDDDVAAVTSTAIRLVLDVSGVAETVANATLEFRADEGVGGTGVAAGEAAEWRLLFGDGTSAFGFVDDATRISGNATASNTTVEIQDGRGDFESEGTTVTVAAVNGTLTFAVLLAASLDGASEAPDDGHPDATGDAEVLIQDDHMTLCWWIRLDGLDDAASAHIHDGPEGEAGPVAIPLDTPTNGTGSGCTDDGSLDQAMFERLATTPSDFYVNVHNAGFPAGAVRGQLAFADGREENETDEGTGAEPQEQGDDDEDAPAPGLALLLVAVGLTLVLARRRRST